MTQSSACTNAGLLAKERAAFLPGGIFDGMKKGPERGLRAFIGVVIRGLFVTSRSDVPTFRVDGQGGLPYDYAVSGGAVHGLAFGDAEGLEEGLEVAEGDVDAVDAEGVYVACGE